MTLAMTPVENPSAGQLERALSQRIQALYREQLGHQPGKVSCQLFDTTLAIVLESSITPLEQRLSEAGQADLAEQVRSQLRRIMKPLIKETVEAVLRVEATDVLSDATLATGRIGIIVSLVNTPQVRNPEAIPKVKKGRFKLAEDLDQGTA